MLSDNHYSVLFTKSISLSDYIYSQLRAAILTGELKPGDRLIEMEVAKKMGTSQAPVREALQRLENDGLVEKNSRCGSYVTEISYEGIEELFSIRALIEKFAIRRTSSKITNEQCDQLQSIVGSMYKCAERDDLLMMGFFDMEFHRLICEWSGSTILVKSWMPLYSQIQRFLTQHHHEYYPALKEIARLHEPIIDVLREGDTELAERVIEEHITLPPRRAD